MMREVKVLHIDTRVMDELAKQYDQLKSLCVETARQRDAGMKDLDDLFHDCIITVAQDSIASSLTSSELATHFCYRFQMIMFQNVKDNNQEKTHYANNNKTQR